MALTAPQRRIDRELSDGLRSREQRVTSQRLVIHRVLREGATHMSAEQVHRATRRALPGISLPTVYSTLDLLCGMGLIGRIDAGTGTVLYDGRREPHHHAVCRSCGRVWDLTQPVDVGTVADEARISGLEVEAVQVLAVGRCAEGCPASMSRSG